MKKNILEDYLLILMRRAATPRPAIRPTNGAGDLLAVAGYTATYRSSVCRSPQYGIEYGNSPKYARKFFEPWGERDRTKYDRTVRYPLMLNGREIAGPPGMSFAEAFKEKGKQSFMKFHEGKTLSSFKGYANRLEEMDWLYIPEDM